MQFPKSNPAEFNNLVESIDSEALLKAAASSNSLIFQIYNPSGILVLSNATYEHLHSKLFETKFSVGQHFSEFFPEPFLSSFGNLWTESMESGFAAKESVHRLLSNDEEFFLAIRVLYFNNKANLQYFLVIFNDITTYAKIKNNLSITSANLKALLSSNTYQYILVDKNYKVILANDLAQSTVRKIHHKELLPGSYLLDFVFESDKTALIRHIGNGFRGKEASAERKITSHSGKELWIEISTKPIWTQEGKIENVLVSYFNITERKKFELALRESEANLHIVFNSGLHGFVLVENDGSCLIFNAQAEHFFRKYANLQVQRDKKLENLSNKEFENRLSRSIRMAQNGGRIYSEEEFQEKEGKKFFSIQFDPVTNDKDKKVTIWISDITQRKQAELSLQKSESNLKAIFNNTTSSFFLIGSNNKIEAFNKAAQEEILSQFSAQIKEGDDIVHFLDPENLENCQNSLSLAFSGKKVTSENSITTLQKTKWFERHFNPIFDENGKVERITVWSIDISERKKFENALLANEKKFRKLTSLSPVGIYQTDENLQIIYLNDSMLKTLGISQTEIYTRKWKHTIHPEDLSRFEELTQIALENHQEYSIEYRIENPTEFSSQYISEQAIPLFDDTQKFIGYLGTLVDITEHISAQRLRSERDLAKLSLKFKSDFLAGMSHEIRTPLNSIISYSELLMESSMENTQKEQLQTVFNAAIHLRSIVNDILDLSKLEAGKEELKVSTFPLQTLLEECYKTFKLMAQDKGLTFSYDPSPRISIKSDKRRLIQIISNLVKNGIKFTDSGKVEMKLMVLETSNSKIKIRFEVIDTGKGIKKEELSQLFSDYTQLQTSLTNQMEGTGLGLAISKKLVELLGGEIGVESNYGSGSTFWFECWVEKSTTDSYESPVNDKIQFRGKILLAEDNAINRMAFQSILRKLGIEVVVASNGLEVLELMKIHSFDLVFMDIQMPELDGFSAIIRLEESMENLPPIIGLSGNISQANSQNYLRKGMVDFLPKPATSNDFISMLLKWKIPILT